MTIKKFAFTGLLLSSVFLVACQPQETDTSTDTMMLEETTPATGDESIMMEGTDQAMPGEEEVMMQDETMMEDDTSPTASPMVETEMDMETDTTM